MTGLWDGRFNQYRTCESCTEIRDHFACSTGWIFTDVWVQLEAGFFPAMVAGGPCMEGLSPANKARLFERRLAWLEEEQDAAKERIKFEAAWAKNHPMESA